MSRLRTIEQVAKAARARGLEVSPLHHAGTDLLKPGGVAVSCPECGVGQDALVRELVGGELAGICQRCNADVVALLATARTLAVVPSGGGAGSTAMLSLDALLGQIEELMRRFVVFATDHQVVAVVLWVAHSHAIDAADVTAYLHVHSAEKRSGKSRLLDVLELLVRVAWRVVTPTEAVTYRKITRDAPTLLLDEVDAIFGKGAKEHEGLRALLNAGFQRGTRVPRCVGPKQDLQEFEVFCCKALAGIGGLPDTVADRSIPIRLRRRKASEPVARFRKREVKPTAGVLRDQLTAWASTAVDVLKDARPLMPGEISDRAEESWETLVAIADMAGGDWPARARRAAVALGTGSPEDGAESIGVRLLGDVRVVLAGLGDPERVTTADLLTGLHGLEEAPWADWYGKPLGAEKLARTLREFDCKSRDIRTSEGSKKGYYRAPLEDAFQRYLPGFTLSTRDTRDNSYGYAENSTSQPATNTLDVAGLKAPQTRMVEPMSRVSRVDTRNTEFERVLLVGERLGYPAVLVAGGVVSAGASGWWDWVEPRYQDTDALAALEAAALNGGASCGSSSRAGASQMCRLRFASRRRCGSSATILIWTRMLGGISYSPSLARRCSRRSGNDQPTTGGDPHPGELRGARPRARLARLPHLRPATIRTRLAGRVLRPRWRGRRRRAEDDHRQGEQGTEPVD